jgi:carbon-monoxide dehydrogenase large subunit
MDALSPFGITHIDIPLTPAKVWHALRDAGATADAGR